METQQMGDNIEVYLFKDTKDEYLKLGQLVCYKNTFGVYAHLGKIHHIYTDFGIKHYQIEGAMGAYLANELKLTNQ